MLNFAEQLRELMSERAVGTVELARRVPCDKAYISRMVSGQQAPSARIAARLDELLRAGGALESAAARRKQVVPRQLGSLSATEIEEVTIFLDDQWHALVKADNLLGSRYARYGVCDQLAVIEALLASISGAARRPLLKLGAKYAESAAWLYEDGADGRTSRYWISRAMRWAEEGDDDLLTAWTLFRRSQQATAVGRTGDAGRLIDQAWRTGASVPGPMMAALLQQEAHIHALSGNETESAAAIDRAIAYAVTDDQGDAARGHGSFCTPAYLEMQRGLCLATLRRPVSALAAFDTAIKFLPAVYHRDRGVALSGQAACLAAVGEAEKAAAAASQALAIAEGSGSMRIMRMVKKTSADLDLNMRHSPAARGLRLALREAVSA